MKYSPPKIRKAFNTLKKPKIDKMKPPSNKAGKKLTDIAQDTTKDINKKVKKIENPKI